MSNSETLLGQSTFPRTAVINNDTVVLFTLQQEELIYAKFQRLDACDTLLNECVELKNNYIQQIGNYKSMLDVNKAQVEYYERLVQINKDMNKDLNNQLDILTNNNNKQQKQIKRLKKQRNFFLVGSGFLTAVLVTAVILN